MNEKCTKPNKWRDEAGNVYTVEQSARNKRFVVIRTNPGGNRKAAKVVLGRDLRDLEDDVSDL